MVFKRLVAGLLLLCLSVSSSGVSFNAHLCNGELVSWSFIKKPKACKKKVQFICANVDKNSDFLKEINCCSEKKLCYQQNFIKENSVTRSAFQNSTSNIVFSFFYNRANTFHVLWCKTFANPPPLIVCFKFFRILSFIQVYRL